MKLLTSKYKMNMWQTAEDGTVSLVGLDLVNWTCSSTNVSRSSTDILRDL